MRAKHTRTSDTRSHMRGCKILRLVWTHVFKETQRGASAKGKRNERKGRFVAQGTIPSSPRQTSVGTEKWDNSAAQPTTIGRNPKRRSVAACVSTRTQKRRCLGNREVREGRVRLIAPASCLCVCLRRFSSVHCRETRVQARWKKKAEAVLGSSKAIHCLGQAGRYRPRLCCDERYVCAGKRSMTTTLVIRPRQRSSSPSFPPSLRMGAGGEGRGHCFGEVGDTEHSGPTSLAISHGECGSGILRLEFRTRCHDKNAL